MHDPLLEICDTYTPILSWGFSIKEVVVTGIIEKSTPLHDPSGKFPR